MRIHAAPVTRRSAVLKYCLFGLVLSVSACSGGDFGASVDVPNDGGPPIGVGGDGGMAGDGDAGSSSAGSDSNGGAGAGGTSSNGGADAGGASSSDGAGAGGTSGSGGAGAGGSSGSGGDGAGGSGGAAVCPSNCLSMSGYFCDGAVCAMVRGDIYGQPCASPNACGGSYLCRSGHCSSCTDATDCEHLITDENEGMVRAVCSQTSTGQGSSCGLAPL